jgi:16S rRNA (guanine527-N7)-methyltransferase
VPERGGVFDGDPVSGSPLATLRLILSDARGRGFLGPGPIEVHIRHAAAFAAAARPEDSGAADPSSVVDLGSGGGVPGLVLALLWENSMLFLVDARLRRAAFLREAVHELGLDGRVSVSAERAEVLGRTQARRGAYELVVARGFGTPAIVAECAAPFLAIGGKLVVSEPPRDAPVEERRWPDQGLAMLGMGPAAPSGSEYRFVVVPQLSLCPERFPRRVGVPAKRPLF